MSIAQRRFGNMLDSISIFTDTTQDLPSSNVASVQEVEQGDDLGERLYDYATSNESAAGFEDRFFWGTNTEQLTRDQLEAEFNDGKNGQLQGAFGSFDNYMAYMDERQDLIDAGELKSSWWASQDTVIDVTNQSGLAFELDPENPNFRQNIDDYMVASGQAGYSSNSQIFNALYQKYTGGAADGKSYNDDGDVFRFNGSSFVRTYENPRGGFIDTALPALIVGVAGAALAGPLAAGLQSAGLSGAVASATAQSITNAAIQLAATGEVNISDALMAGASSIVGNTVTSTLQESGALSMTAGAFDAATQVAEIGEQGINAADVISAVRDYIDMSGGEVGGVSVDDSVIFGDPGFVGTEDGPLSQLPNYQIPDPDVTDSEDGGGGSSAAASADSASASAADSADSAVASADSSAVASDAASDAADDVGGDASDSGGQVTTGVGDLPEIGDWVYSEEDGLWKQVGGYSDELGDRVVVYSGEVISGPQGQDGDTKSDEDWSELEDDFLDGTYVQGVDLDGDGVIDGMGNDVAADNDVSIIDVVGGSLSDIVRILTPNGNDIVVTDPSSNDITVTTSNNATTTNDINTNEAVLTNDASTQTNDVSTNDVISVVNPGGNDVVTVSSGNEVTTGNDVSTGNEVTTGNEVSTGNEVTVGNDVTTTNDVSTGNDVTTSNDVSTGSEVTTGNDASTTGDDTKTTGGDGGGDGGGNGTGSGDGSGDGDGDGDGDGNGDGKGRGQSLLIGGMMRPTLQPQRGTPVTVPDIYDPISPPGLMAVPQSLALVELEKAIADLMMPEQRKPSGLLLGTLNSRNVA